jgi:hypothetical protein
MDEDSGVNSPVADISVEADRFEFGRVLGDDFELELERVVPFSRDELTQLVWVVEGDPDTFETTIDGYSCAEIVQRLANRGGRSLFEVEWTAEMGAFLTALVEHDVYVLGGTYSDGTWDFRLRFVDRDELVECYERLTAKHVPVTLNRLYNPGPGTETPETMTDRQRETVRRAYERGYFEVPRRVTIQELADDEGVSDSAFSQRLRRSLESLIEESFSSEPR